MKTVIMAGGRGTRIASLASDIPKPMILLEGVPVLEREVRCLRDQGFTDIILTVSHMADKIIGYFGGGERFGVQLQYYVETQPMGNAGALFELKDELTEDFLLLNADSLFDIDFERFIAFHKIRGGLATLFTHPNDHPYDSGLVVADKVGTVIQWLAKEDERSRHYKNRVNAGLHILSPKLLELRPDTPKIDLDRQILKPLAGTGKLFCYDSPEYVKDMGTPERYAQVSADWRSGRVQARNLRRKQKAVFLDRDGTVNRYVGFLRNIDDFELLPGAAEAIRKINRAGYLVIIITNQPVIARGEVTYEELDEIHNKMETLLGEQGAYLDAIYYCPHHPDKGFVGEVPKLKIDCTCRKPKPGMLLRAALDLNINLKQSWMVGDGENDMQAGQMAGCRCVRIGKDGINGLWQAVGKIGEEEAWT